MEAKPWSEEEKKLFEICFLECANLPPEIQKKGFSLIVNRFAAKGFHRTKEELKAYCRLRVRQVQTGPAKGK